MPAPRLGEGEDGGDDRGGSLRAAAQFGELSGGADGQHNSCQERRTRSVTGVRLCASNRIDSGRSGRQP
jgi:hypothetical protein